MCIRDRICTYLTVFVGMSAFGLLAWNFTRQRAFIIVGMILGILFTFAVTKIVVNRSVRIFNRGPVSYTHLGQEIIRSKFHWLLVIYDNEMNLS